MKFSDEEMFAFACDFSSNSPQIFAHSIKILLATFAPILLCTSAASARPNEWSEREAAAEAQHDIHAHKIKFYWYGGYASMPIGVPARYFHIADRYPHADGGIGCSFMIARSGSDSVSIQRPTTNSCCRTFFGNSELATFTSDQSPLTNCAALSVLLSFRAKSRNL